MFSFIWMFSSSMERFGTTFLAARVLSKVIGTNMLSLVMRYRQHFISCESRCFGWCSWKKTVLKIWQNSEFWSISNSFLGLHSATTLKKGLRDKLFVVKFIFAIQLRNIFINKHQELNQNRKMSILFITLFLPTIFILDTRLYAFEIDRLVD